MKKVGIILVLVCLISHYNAQVSISGCTLSGGMGLGSACANGCISGCDLTAFSFFGLMCNGTAISGSCSQQIQTTSYSLPTGCTANVTAEFITRPGCSASGADGSDFLEVGSSGGTFTSISPNPFNQPGSSNANLTSTFTKTGGTFYIRISSNRRDEIGTWTITLSGTCGINCSMVLPITLTDFYAKPIQSAVQINWHVATELDVNYYLIEKSLDGLNYELLAPVKSIAGASGKNNLNYSTMDYNPKNGIIYYRLANVDLDGTTTYHKPIMINYNTISNANVWINQTETDIIVSYQNMFFSKIYYLMDMNGRKVGEYKNENNELNYFIINKTTLTKGLYVFGCIDSSIPPQKILIN